MDATGAGACGRRFQVRMVLIAMIAMVMVVPAAAPVAALQSSKITQMTTINGTTVAWGDEWTESPEMSGPSEVAADAAGVTAIVGEFPDIASLQELFDELLVAYGEGYVIADSGETPDGGHYALWDAASGNHVMGRVMYAPGSDLPIVTMAVIEPGFLESALVDLRTFTINDVPAWDGADEAAIVAQYSPGASDAPVFPGAAPAEAPATGSAQGTLRPSDLDRPAVHSEEVFGGGTLAGSFTSDQFAYTIAWDATWQTQDGWITSDTGEGFDAVMVEAVSPVEGAVRFYIASQIPGYTIDDALAYWTSADYLDEFKPAGTEVVLAESSRNSGAVVLVGPSPIEGDPELWVSVIELAFVGRELEVESQVIAPLSHFPTVYANAQQGIVMEGNGVVGYFSLEDLLDVLP